MSSATVAERVSIEDVLRHNKIDVEIDRDFITEHLSIARAEINRLLGSSFTISGTDYPDLYDEAIKKKTYASMLPYMHTFYMAGFPNMDEERGMFYKSPSEVNALVGTLENRVNQVIEILKDDIDDYNLTQETTDTTIATSGMIFSAAGGNNRYKPKYYNEADNDDKE